MIDTHCHFYGEAFDNDRPESVRRAVDAGVSLMLLPAIDSLSHSRQEALAQAYPDCFRQMMGLHPTSVTADPQAELDIVRQKLFDTNASYCAVGEIGLDALGQTGIVALVTQPWAQVALVEATVLAHVVNEREMVGAYGDVTLLCRGTQPQQRGKQDDDSVFHFSGNVMINPSSLRSGWREAGESYLFFFHRRLISSSVLPLVSGTKRHTKMAAMTHMTPYSA